jgi:hypothetical protein
MPTDSLARLINAITPPLPPTGIVRTWDAVEHELKLAFPADYKEFLSTYGTGVFSPMELFIWNLLEDNTDIDFIRGQNEFARDAETRSISFQQLQESTPVFPVGADAFAYEFFLGQDRNPDNWYMIVVHGGLVYHQFPGLSLTGFLTALFVDKSPVLTSLLRGSSYMVSQQTFIPAPPSDRRPNV